MTLFWPRAHGWEKWSQSGKMPANGRAEIENVKSTKSDIFNFNSATIGDIFTLKELEIKISKNKQEFSILLFNF